jgi:osmotically-inducible protein OsmY
LLALATLIALSACASTPRIGASTSMTTSRFNTTELIARVKTALLNDEIVGLRRIDVHAVDGDVTLTGRVASAGERDRAVTIARAVEGVWSVRSELQIQP